MMIREPIVSDAFYPADPDRCREELAALFETAPDDTPLGDKPLFGGLVPHAGWSYSGAVAAAVFKQLAARSRPSTIVLFGGVHRYRGKQAALFGHGRWDTPLGPVPVDARLAERILGYTNLIVDDPYAHEDEHSIEVQLPLVRHLFPQASIVPIMVPCSSAAPEVGDAVARTIKAYQYDAILVGTTDLTHYGPRYGFEPRGAGPEAVRWAGEVNDRRFIDLVCRMRAAELVPEAREHNNACNSGAAAATVAAVAALGANAGVLLARTTSAEVVGRRGGGVPSDSVGYAGIVFQ